MTKRFEYQDAVNRIEVKRDFSFAKRSFGLGLTTMKMEPTTKSSIIIMNVDRITWLSIMRFLLSLFQGAYVGLNFEQISDSDLLSRYYLQKSITKVIMILVIVVIVASIIY